MAVGVGRVEDHTRRPRIEQYTLELLQAIREHHPHIYAGAWVDPYTSALEAGLNPDSPCYREAMEYLQAQGVLGGGGTPRAYGEAALQHHPPGHADAAKGVMATTHLG